jgi:phosphatidylserine/phosphatidylglycerophosphate/cardiolipin synthase-like enzyme
MHAKVMVVWRQGEPVAAFLGSENLSRTSLDRNREIGVLLGPAGARQVADALQPVLSCG